MASDEDIKTLVRDRYGAIAREASSCCGGISGANMIGRAYDGVEGRLPEADLNLGCGVPTRHAAIRPGDTVLDLGSGAGNDAFIARHEAGEAGKIIGVDMTPDMIARAGANAEKLGFANVEFRLGDIEGLPVEDSSIDVIISNCVLNLVPNKAAALAEMARVLRPGGHFCVSDIVATGLLPEAVSRVAALHVGCVAGALPEAAYLALIDAAGFAPVTIASARRIDLPEDLIAEALADGMAQEAMAAFTASDVTLRSITVIGVKALPST